MAEDKTVHHLVAVDLVVQRPEAANGWHAYHQLAHQALFASPPKRKHAPRSSVPGGLMTKAEAAAKLGCSIKTLDGHIASGAIGYVALGHGMKRPRKRFTPADLDTFITNQTRKDSPACLSTETRARHTGTSTSKSEVIAFSALRKPGTDAKRKR